MRKEDGTEGSGGSGRGGRDVTEKVEEMPEDVFQSVSEVTRWKDERWTDGQGEEERCGERD